MNIKLRTPLQNFVLGLSGSTALLIGSIVIFGWYSQISSLIVIHPSFAPMQYNTALGFVLCGATLLCMAKRYNKTAFCFSIAAFVLSISTFSQYIFDANYGIDTLFIDPYFATKTSHIGRMSPNTSLSFAITSGALSLWFLGHYRSIPYLHSKLLLRLTGAVILTMGGFAIIGYTIDIENSYGWGSLTLMALHTASGFVILSIGILTYSWEPHDKSAAPQIFGWNASILIALIMVIVLAMWIGTTRQEGELTQQSAQENMDFLIEHLNSEAAMRSALLRRITLRWEQRKVMPEDDWRADARNYINDHPELLAIGWISPSLRLTWLETRQGEEALGSLIELLIAQHQNKLHANKDKSFPLLSNGYPGASHIVTTLMPIQTDRRFNGYLITQIDMRRIFLAYDSFGVVDKLRLKLDMNGNTIIDQTPEDAIFSERWRNKKTFVLHQTETVLQAWPTQKMIDEKSSPLPEVILIMGAAISLLVALAVYYAQISLYRTKLHKESERQLALILDNAAEGIYGLDSNGLTTFTNRAAIQMVGYRADEMLGNKQHDLIHHHYADGSEFPIEQCGIFHSISTGKTHKSEPNDVFWRKDGTCFPVEYVSAPIKDVKGRIVGATVVFRDISERQQAEQEREKLISNLEESNRDLESFAYIASHDLRSPLHSIHKIADMIEFDFEGDMPISTKEALDKLRNRVQRMNRLLVDLLEYSKIGHIGMKEHDIVNGTTLIEETLELVPETEGFIVTLGDGLKNVEVARYPIQQALINFISNAIKHHDKETGHLTIDAKRSRNFYTFSVEDDGPGIPFEYHQKIFEMFKTLKPRDRVEGSGMGLSIVKKIVESSGGEVWVEPAKERGTRFCFTWPRPVPVDIEQKKQG